MQGDVLRLTMPASGPYTRLARVAITGLATRLGFSFEEVEDLRLAVAEVCTKLIEAAPDAEHLAVGFHVGDGRLDIDIGVDDDRHIGRDDLGQLADQIVDATVDDIEFREAEHLIRVTKTHTDD